MDLCIHIILGFETDMGSMASLYQTMLRNKLPYFLKEEFMKTNLLFPTEVGKYPPSDQLIE